MTDRLSIQDISKFATELGETIKCIHCHNPGKLPCRCKWVVYCSPECMQADKHRHEYNCATIFNILDCVEVVMQPGKGRGLRATCDIESGQSVALYTAKAIALPFVRTNDDIRYMSGAPSDKVSDQRRYRGTGPGTGFGYLINDPRPSDIINQIFECKTVREICQWERKFAECKLDGNVRPINIDDVQILIADCPIKKGDDIYMNYSTGYWIGMASLEGKYPETKMAATIYDSYSGDNACIRAFDKYDISAFPDRDSIESANRCWPSYALLAQKADKWVSLMRDSSFVEKYIINKWLEIFGFQERGYDAWKKLYDKAIHKGDIIWAKIQRRTGRLQF